jgi:hypothetical protein
MTRHDGGWAHFTAQVCRVTVHVRCSHSQISYAPKAGGIGPHVDNYDVFLLQVGHFTSSTISPTSMPQYADCCS